MADYEDIIQHYTQEGWLTIPSYYNTEGKEPRCKICGHEKRSRLRGYMFRLL